MRTHGPDGQKRDYYVRQPCAEKAIEKEIEVDRDEFKRELEKAEKEYADAS